MKKIKEEISKYLAKNDYDRVKHLLSVNEKLDDDYKLAVSALVDSRTGNYADAKKKYKKSLVIKDSPSVHLNYAVFLFGVGEQEAAEEQFKLACKSDELLPTALSNLCLFYLKTKQKKAVDDILLEHKHLHTNKLIAPFVIAQKFKAEKELVENLIGSFKSDQETFLLTCIDILVQNYSFQEALEFYSSYAAFTDYKSLRKRICSIAFKANNFLYTIDVANSYLDTYEYDELVLKALLHSYLNLGKYQELEVRIPILRKKYPCGHLLYTNAIGMGAMKIGNYHTARKYFLKLFVAEKSNWQNLVNLSSAQIEDNKRASALVSLSRAEKALRLNLTNSKIQINDLHLQHIKINKASLMGDIGLVDQSHQILDSLIANRPKEIELVKKKLFSAGYNEGLKKENIFQLFEQYRKLLEALHPRKTVKKIKKNKPRPTIAYVSGDVCRSSVSSFLLNFIISHASRSEVDVLVIHTGTRTDDVTQKYSDSKCKVFLAPEARAESIRDMLKKNDVDLVVDCIGVTRGSRPEIFAGDEMPYAISVFFGHGYTSGNPFIDFILAPPSMIPSHEKKFYTEKVVTVSGAFPFPYLSLKQLEIKSNLSNKHIRLGCISRPIRLSQSVISTYAKILNTNQNISITFGSVLVKDHFVVQHITSQFSMHGVCSSKLRFIEGSMNEILQNIDICLDQWPQNSGTTLIESLLCGVPVVTKKGDLSYGKFGSTILTEIEKDEWIAESEEQFVEIVGKLIIQLRGNLISSIALANLSRQRLTDATKITKAIEVLAKRILRGGPVREGHTDSHSRSQEQ